MSINDLIHTNAHNAFEQGVKTERERIVKLLEENSAKDPDCKCDTCEDERFLIALIKGEQK